MVIQALPQRGLYQCDIAEQMCVHPRTVRRALAWCGASTARHSRKSVSTASEVDNRHFPRA